MQVNLSAILLAILAIVPPSLCAAYVVSGMGSKSRTPTKLQGSEPCTKYNKGGCVKHPSGEPLVVKEGYVGKAAIWFIGYHLCRILDTEMPKRFITFEELADWTKGLLLKGDPAEQSKVVFDGMTAVVPWPVPWLIRTVFPMTARWVCEANAACAPFFTTWLVGPSSRVEGEVQLKGDKKEIWKSTVQIERCRYLEASGCKTACVNLCKVPTQRFFTENFGLPLTMTPNFEDCSCTMTFGQYAPPLEEDAVCADLCYDVCVNVPPSIEDIRMRIRPGTAAATAANVLATGGNRRRTCHTTKRPQRGGEAEISLAYSNK